jgi:hypothetical protein
MAPKVDQLVPPSSWRWRYEQATFVLDACGSPVKIGEASNWREHLVIRDVTFGPLCMLSFNEFETPPKSHFKVVISFYCSKLQSRWRSTDATQITKCTRENIKKFHFQPRPSTKTPYATPYWQGTLRCRIDSPWNEAVYRRRQFVYNVKYIKNGLQTIYSLFDLHVAVHWNISVHSPNQGLL